MKTQTCRRNPWTLTGAPRAGAEPHAIATSGLPCGFVLNSPPPSAAQDINSSSGLAVRCLAIQHRVLQAASATRSWKIGFRNLKRSTRRLRRLHTGNGADAGTRVALAALLNEVHNLAISLHQETDHRCRLKTDRYRAQDARRERMRAQTRERSAMNRTFARRRRKLCVQLPS